LRIVGGQGLPPTQGDDGRFAGLRRDADDQEALVAAVVGGDGGQVERIGEQRRDTGACAGIAVALGDATQVPSSAPLS